ncbi:MAG: hypothetical protein GKR94_25920 [Gammaproteobacteria bacterium]|nr:hypothetical protein [Gammaproteobacteria bacterium]
MARRKRKIDRESGKLADTSLIVIASEDKYAVQQYFDLFESMRIQFEVLNTEDGKSSPQKVLQRLKEYQDEFQIGEEDQFWVVTDIDHWANANHIKNLVEVLRASKQREISIALSNPCFDLWLLLHFTGFPSDGVGQCDEVGKLIRDAVGSYNKTRVFDLPFNIDNVKRAVNSAKTNDPGGKILESAGTHIYRILDALVQSGVVTIG